MIEVLFMFTKIIVVTLFILGVDKIVNDFSLKRM